MHISEVKKDGNSRQCTTAKNSICMHKGPDVRPLFSDTPPRARACTRHERDMRPRRGRTDGRTATAQKMSRQDK